MKKIGKYILPLLIIPRAFFGQIDTTITSSEKLQNLLEESSADAEDSQLIDLLEELITNPVNVNIASSSELSRIPFINPSISEQIVKYRESSGSFSSKRDLLNVPGIYGELLTKISPFISIEESESLNLAEVFQSLHLKYRSRLINDLQKREGFSSAKYNGSVPKIYNRAKLRFGEYLKVGFLAEKDAGEKSVADFTSGYIELINTGFSGNVIIGDFLAEFGLGLALWSPYAFSKGSEAVNSVIKSARAIRPYGSSDESRFFRGIAIQTELFGAEVSAFYSSHRLDASIENGYATSIVYSGLHRTDNEHSKENSLKTVTAGFSASITPFENITIEGLALNSSFDKSLNTSGIPGEPQSEFTFVSAGWRANLGELFFTGEVSSNLTQSAVITSALLPVGKKIDVVASFRNYPRDYFHLYANGFGERSATRNEQGFYLGAKWRSPIGEINIYLDHFKFPGSSNLSDFSSSGDDFLFSFRTKILKNLSLSLKYKDEQKADDIVEGNKLIAANSRKQNLRGEISCNIGRNFKSKTRLEFVRFYPNTADDYESGYLFYQNFQARLFRILDLHIRLTMFETESYKSRVYQFENDLPGQLSNLPLYGKGMKWYLLLKFRPLKYVTISLKYSELYKPEEHFLSSGENMILGNLDNRLSFQLDFKF